MTPTTYQLVQQARNQQEALFAIATALDEIKAVLAAKPADDGWSDWGSQQVVLHDAAVRGGYVPEMATVVSTDAIAALRERIGLETDPEERRALDAQLRLLTDKGRPGPVESVVGRTEVVEVGDDMNVEILPVSAERRAARAEWARRVELEQYLIPIEDEWTDKEAQNAFAVGGPLWLYYGNRIAVLSLPVGERQWLVHEVAKDSQAQAHELARDILKSEESIDPGVTAEAIDAMSGTHG